MGRRGFVVGIAGVWTAAGARTAFGDVSTDAGSPRDFDVKDFTVEGDRQLSNRFVLCVPTHLTKDQKVPLLVALHGLGETTDARTGAYAFLEHYGLADAYERCRRPPVVRTLAKDDYFSEALLAELNEDLRAAPFQGIAIACPYMPNVNRAPQPSQMFDRYASWIVDVVIPRARREAPVYTDAAHTSIDGVSLGGYTGIEVFLRKPDVFGAWGCVQGAFGAARVAGYADRLAAVYQKSPRDFHLETSKGDPYHDVTLSLADALIQRGVPNSLLVYPGPHDQPWLRESGIIGMLRWHDARLR